MVVVAVGYNLEDTIAAAMRSAKTLVTDRLDQNNAAELAVGDNLGADQQNDWYDGLGYCEFW